MHHSNGTGQKAHSSTKEDQGGYKKRGISQQPKRWRWDGDGEDWGGCWLPLGGWNQWAAEHGDSGQRRKSARWGKRQRWYKNWCIWAQTKDLCAAHTEVCIYNSLLQIMKKTLKQMMRELQRRQKKRNPHLQPVQQTGRLKRGMPLRLTMMTGMVGESP